MDRVIKFNLSGNSAFFKSNECNAGDISYSYGHVHKLALLGIIGAILGLNGHNFSYTLYKKNYTHPEFYEILKDCLVSIKPNSKYGDFNRGIHKNINSTGLGNSNSKAGTSLVYKEQWIEEVSWDIFIIESTFPKKYRKKLIEYLENSFSFYTPYLGKTNHPAIISNFQILEIEKLLCKEGKIDSLFFKNIIKKESPKSIDYDFLNAFLYQEYLPVKYENNSCLYEYELLYYTNKKYSFIDDCDVFVCNNENLFFY